MAYRVRDLRGFDRQVFKEGGAKRPRYLERQPFCWMCPTTRGVATREHVFGRWLMELLPRESLEFTPRRAGLGHDYSVARGPMHLEKLRVGRVCAECNHGWMSRLEVEAKRMLFGTRRRLAESDATRLAHWALKTALVLNVSQPAPLVWNEADRHRLRFGPLERTWVSVQRVEGVAVHW